MVSADDVQCPVAEKNVNGGNASLFQEFPEAPHKKADILIACDHVETGYDNSAVRLMGIDRRMLRFSLPYSR